MKITCPHCQKTINAPDKFAGRVVNCPGCKGEMELPTLEEMGLAVPQQQAPAPPPPPPAPKPEPVPQPVPDGDDLGPDEEKDAVDERAATRRDSKRRSKRGSKRGSRAGGGRGDDGEGALKSYRRNMTIMGIVLLLMALGNGVAVGVIFKTAAKVTAKVTKERQQPTSAAAESTSPQAPVVAESPPPPALPKGMNLGAIMAMGAAVIAAPFIFIGLVDLLLCIFAFLKKNWVNWIVAIFYGLVLPFAVLGVVFSGGNLIALIGPVTVIVMFVLAIMNIRSYGKVKAAGLDASGGSSGSKGRSRSRGARGAKSEPKADAAKADKKRTGAGTIRRRTTGSRSRSRRRR